MNHKATLGLGSDGSLYGGRIDAMPAPPRADTAPPKVLVWDAPTRVFHWMLAASIAGTWLTAESERLRDVHVLLGYTALALLLFRILWGFAGTRYARFASFAFRPGAVLSYLKSLLRGSPDHHVGHNPAGSWAIYALLALVFLAGASGWLANTDTAPEWLSELHEGIAGTLLALIGIHIAGAVASSLLHRENLILAMLTGYKHGDKRQAIAKPRWFTAMALVAGVVLLWMLLI